MQGNSGTGCQSEHQSSNAEVRGEQTACTDSQKKGQASGSKIVSKLLKKEKKENEEVHPRAGSHEYPISLI